MTPAMPQQAQAIDAFARAFEAQRYAGQPASPEQLRELLRRLRRALPWRARPTAVTDDR